ncbi:MAG: tetratricopeptide repeat protein [Planctomyces sp.]|nr:tetratricopeptide repeat protein [Planctomyces sp.]
MQNAQNIQAGSARRRTRSAGPLVAALLVSLAAADAIHPRPTRADATDDFNVALQLYKSGRYELASTSFADFLKKYADHPRRPLAELYLGQSLMQERKFADARDLFSKFLDAHPEHADRPLAAYRLGECNYFLDAPREARAAFEAFLEAYPQHDLAAWAWHYLGESRLQLDDAPAAIEAFQTVVDKHPQSPLAPESRFGLARAYENDRQTDKALAAYRELSADDAHPRAADALFNLGSLQFDAQDYAAASESFAAVVRRFPESRHVPLAELNAGISLVSLKEYDKAIRRLTSAAQSPDREQDANYWIGIAHKGLNRFEDAVAVLKPAYEKHAAEPGAERLLFHWADSELRQGHYDVAIPLLLKVADEFPRSELADDALHLAVDASLKTNALDQAEQLHARMMREFPNSGLAMLERLLYGRIQLARADQLGAGPPLSPEAAPRVREAIAEFERVLKDSKFESTTSWARLLLGRAQLMAGDPPAALAALLPLNERIEQGGADEFAEALMLSGRAAIATEDWAAADGHIERYLARRPPSADRAAALSQLAVVKIHAGREDELDALWGRFREAGAPASVQAAALHAAAELMFERENWDAARQLFQRLSEVPPENGYRAIALSGSGHASYLLQDYKSAAADFSALLLDAAQEDPKLTADAAYMQALSLDAGGDKTEAAKAYEAGVARLLGENTGAPPERTDPDDVRNAYRMSRGAARAWASIGEASSADAAYQRTFDLLQRLPEDQRVDSDRLLSEWAVVNYKAERFERSDELFQRLVDLFPNSAEVDHARQSLAESLLQDGRFVEARAAFEELLARPELDSLVREAALLNLMELAARESDWDAAQARANEFLAAAPESSRRLSAEYRLAEAALRTDKHTDARDGFAAIRARLVDGAAPRFEWAEGVWLLLAESELQLKNYSQVETLVAEFHERFPESPVAYQADEVLGRSQVRRARFSDARATFAKVVDSPTGRKTETAARAQTAIADSYVTEKNFESAVPEYYKVVFGYSLPELQAAAGFQAGQCEEVLKRLDGALKSYELVVKDFPNTSFANRARERLEVLKPLVRPAVP